MNRNNQKLLTVCASALLALSSSYANAQGNNLSNKTSDQLLALPAGTAAAPKAQDASGMSSANMPADAMTQAVQSEPSTGTEDVPPVLSEQQQPPILKTENTADYSEPTAVATMPTTQVGSLAPRGTDRIVNLRDAVAVGVLTNPATESINNNRRATDEELQQAKALYLPSIDMSADGGFQTINSNTRGQPEGHFDRYRSQASLTLTQMLFDGFSTKYENERQYHRVRSAAHRVRESAEFSGLSIIEAYLDVLRQRELLAIADENLKMHNDIMNCLTK